MAIRLLFPFFIITITTVILVASQRAGGYGSGGGNISSRYHQYGKWHNQNRLALSFDTQKFEVRGKGNDDVGVFTIFGVYSTKTQRLNLIKTYQHDRGDPKENLGHEVVIQLTRNLRNRQFEGIWYVRTNQYYQENKSELKFETPVQLFMI
ncbi:hypothetical protein I4U23_031495 [Adineta vaga]|nr:hypothetical protein I4U23_031495 [Adineta vaga]